MSGIQEAQLPSLPGYEFVRELGAGSTGTVYLARQVSTGRSVAVKALSPALFDAPGARDRFRAEARLMTRFDDVNLVNIYDYLEAGDGAYLVMQYVAGTSLRSLMRSGLRFTPEQSLGALAGALSGLAVAHGLGLVHGDLKPENVLVSEDGVSKLVDFGQASPSGSRPSGGTPAYASPEVLWDEDVDARSDVYAAGVVLYELLAGRLPFDGSAGQVAAAHRNAEAPRLDDVPAPLADLVRRSLSKSPADRPGSAAEFLASLEEAATASYGSGWRRRASIAAAVVGALVGAGTAGASAPSAAAAIGRPGRFRHPVRRLAMKVRHAWAAHPVTGVAGAAMVVGAAGAATALVLSGTAGAAGAGPFSVVSASGSPTAVTCQGASRCWVDLGTAVLSMGPGGQRTVSQLPAQVGSVTDVSCASPTYCVAAGSNPAGGGTLATTSDGGLSWRAATLPLGTAPFSSVSCVPGTTQCWAASKSGLFRSSGPSLSAVTVPLGSGPVSLVSCPALNTCTAVSGGTALSTHNGGARWTKADLPGLLYTPASIDCPDARTCWVVGEYTNSLQSQIGTINVTTNGGSTWAQVAFPVKPVPYAFDSVSCWNARSCLVDGTVEWGGLESSSGSPYFLSTSDGGKTWTVHLAPETMPFVPALDCVHATLCWLSGPSGIGTTSDGGASWKVGWYGPQFTLSAISCVNAQQCFAGGAFPDLVRNHVGAFIVASSNPMGVVVGLRLGGGYAGIDSSDPSVTGLTGLSCTPKQCFAIAQTSSSNQPTVLRLDTTGHSAPSALRLPRAVQALSGVSCPILGGCLVTGQMGGQPLLLRQSGPTWSPVALPYGTQSVGPVSCPSSDRCYLLAVGITGPELLAATLGGKQVEWQSVELPAGVGTLTALGCPATSSCWLAGQFSSAHPGGTGAAPPTVEVFRALQVRFGAEALSTSSTTSPSTTETTTSSAATTTVLAPAALTAAAGWARETVPAGVTGVTEIACPSTTACFAVASLSNGEEALLGAGKVGPLVRGRVAPPTTG